jgi:hypothetical protein
MSQINQINKTNQINQTNESKEGAAAPGLAEPGLPWSRRSVNQETFWLAMLQNHVNL